MTDERRQEMLVQCAAADRLRAKAKEMGADLALLVVAYDDIYRSMEPIVHAARRWRAGGKDPEARLAALRDATDAFYASLTAEEQWELDKALGILDDEGTP